ncbi:unnamed protein product [Phytophthora fragariaefolia]|uniref:Unnamed protein product n=1 Tax=Phytophthora fragariaefolia TaxID=1490495 RepID=A0A9W6XC12_9STRA|nr:unnamed protein product [Phytophthora fragariaefolia]
MTAEQRSSERKTFCELIKRLKAIDVQGHSTSANQEWALLVGELACLYAEGVETEKLFDNFARMLEQYYDDETTKSEIWAAGPFLDLPHHESSQEEIKCMVAELERFLHTHALDATNPPAIVTIAKSTGDEYLPPHQLDEVLSQVLHMLQSVFGALSTKFVEYEPVDNCGDDDLESTSD